MGKALALLYVASCGMLIVADLLSDNPLCDAHARIDVDAKGVELGNLLSGIATLSLARTHKIVA